MSLTDQVETITSECYGYYDETGVLKTAPKHERSFQVEKGFTARHKRGGRTYCRACLAESNEINRKRQELRRKSRSFKNALLFSCRRKLNSKNPPWVRQAGESEIGRLRAQYLEECNGTDDAYDALVAEAESYVKADLAAQG
jgi:hypothetical protein